MEFLCDECGCRDYQDIEGWGSDEYGEFADYWCSECSSLVRIYNNNEE